MVKVQIITAQTFEGDEAGTPEEVELKEVFKLDANELSFSKSLSLCCLDSSLP